jgi:hypothetical protein
MADRLDDAAWEEVRAAFIGSRPRVELLAVFMEDWPCDRCHGLIRAGDTVLMDGYVTAHATCPLAWVPTVINGGRTDPQPQPQLRFLAAAPDPPQGEP